MNDTEGIILILSCQKHKHNRLIKYKLDKNEYNLWKVIYVIGDISMNSNYKISTENNMNILYVKCEDSYIHLLKKLSLAIKYVIELYNPKKGILRCGDDLIFNENKLIKFLNKPQPDFVGQTWDKSESNNDRNSLKNILYDPFMVNYYENHKEDFVNPLHNLKNINIRKYQKRPDLIGPAGVIYYLSIKACNILVNHMKKINYNIFFFDEFSKSYPYTIEDVGVSFIMKFNEIHYTNNENMFDTKNALVQHTNEFK